MNKAGKILVFVVVCLAITLVLTLISKSGGGAVMWLGALAIPMIYSSMFGKKDESAKDDDEITLKK